jgi:putative ABC transport system permease protein
MARFKFWRPSLEREVEEELDFHLAMRARDLEARGLSPDEARAQARQSLGDLDAMRRRLTALGARRDRKEHRTMIWSELGEDVRYGLRGLRRQPGFALGAILTLALGIGATTAIFSAVYSVVLRPLPFPEADRVMMVAERVPTLGVGSMSVGNFVDVRDQATSFAAIGSIYWTSFNLADQAEPERVLGAIVTGGYFNVFSARPLYGRVFGAEEDRFGGPLVVVLSHRLWARRFHGDPSVVGSKLRLNGVDHEILGVMPASFDWTRSAEELWVPAGFSPAQIAQHDEHYLTVYGRLRPGVDRRAAGTELDTIMQRLAERYPQENAQRSGALLPMYEVFVGNARERLLVLLGAVGLVLLIACVNVANLLLARGASRARELAVRASLGAGRWRLVRQLVTETAVLAGAAAVLGVGIAALALRGLLAIAPDGVPRLDEAAINLPTLLFTIGLAIVSTLLAGLLPAWRAAADDLVGVLRDGGRAGSSRGGELLKRGLVSTEVALALVLLVGAGLLVRTAQYLGQLDPGFDPNPVLSARVTLAKDGYPEWGQVTAAFGRLADELRAAPGVRASALTSQVPVGPGGGSNGLIPEGRPIEAASGIDTRMRLVTPGYFATMGIALRGRDFTPDDRDGATRVMIVSRGFAAKAWPGQDPIGRRVVCCEGTPSDPMWKTVIGVAADVRANGLDAEAPLEFYLPVAQAPRAAWDWIQRSMMLVARGAPPRSLAVSMREAARRLDPTVALYSVMTMDERLAGGLAPARFNTLLLTALGGLGLLLAAIGIYGVIGYLVVRRVREIGVRMALGATRRQVVWLVVRQTAGPVGIGLVLGTAGAVIAARALAGQLRGVTSFDPTTYLAVVALLALVALVACLGPARQASGVEASAALRAD